MTHVGREGPVRHEDSGSHAGQGHLVDHQESGCVRMWTPRQREVQKGVRAVAGSTRQREASAESLPRSESLALKLLLSTCHSLVLPSELYQPPTQNIEPFRATQLWSGIPSVYVMDLPPSAPKPARAR